MLDRASSLVDPEVLKLISTRFVPVAIDQHVHRTLNNAEGDLFGKILKQAGRDLNGTSQGNYLFSPDGTLLAFANTADSAHVNNCFRIHQNCLEMVCHLQCPTWAVLPGVRDDQGPQSTPGRSPRRIAADRTDS